MVPELNMARKHGEIKFDMVSQMRTSRDEWLILVSVVLVNIAFLVILLEVKMLKVRFQTRSPFWHAQVICTCAHTRSEMKSYQLQLFIPVFWNALKKQLNFVGPLTCAKNFIFQGPCTRGVWKQKPEIWTKNYEVKWRSGLWACWKCGKRITEQKNSLSSAKGFNVLSSLLMDF